MSVKSPHRFLQMEPVTVAQVDEPIDVAEVLRYLGYPAEYTPSGSVAEMLEHWIDQAKRAASPRAVYVVLPVIHKDKRSLIVDTSSGEIEFSGAIGSFLGVSELIVAFIATAGPSIVDLASDLLSQGDDLAALIVNSVGAERAEAAETEAVRQACDPVSDIGFAATLPYSPGYCGMKLTEQQKLFSIFGNQTAGVRLHESCLMTPIKSVSGLVGLGPSELVRIEGTPCDRCELKSCNMRR
ncbi:vitamin B12 dependent-methionine synthase activation domain-containing protein [Crateriforma conspicua]|uniref:Vitamin B12 dependent methionine synthase, activation domain n=1 Tax=Crateriforma conspicua TaxID=2527996 RepID=A0A5C5Y9X9_9PLAN|nr:vitamin B12 dependent-methionine synthase activation domain-containing protein [Crateriforma conspicua]TWT71749.1 Vitamin B12 dependent methionine synthase, activation domain [Crateriforma conspicua]